MALSLNFCLKFCCRLFLYCGGPATIDAMHAIREAMPDLQKDIKPAKKRRKAA